MKNATPLLKETILKFIGYLSEDLVFLFILHIYFFIYITINTYRNKYI
jgi:hypothetical protein